MITEMSSEGPEIKQWQFEGTMRPISSYGLLLLLMLTLHPWCRVFAQANVRETPVGDFTFEGSALGAIVRLGELSKTPIGIVCAPQQPMTAAISIKMKTSTVGAIMDTIISSLPGYRLQVDGSVIHVLPKVLHTAQEKLLKLPVARFYSPSGAPELMNIGLAHVAKKALGIETEKTAQTGAVSVLATWIEHDSSVTMNNTTIQQILDAALIKSNGISGWIVLPFNDYRMAIKTDEAWRLAPYASLAPMSGTICR